MNPEPIHQAGNDIADISAAARERTKNLLASLDDAASGAPGWRSGQELRNLRQAWERRIEQLVDDTANAAQALREAAGTVAASDQEGERRMMQVLHDMTGESR
ncbi:hypothetical protein [Gandjariella thermophila]|uniref:ESAT-6-like protein n=1 Tax=Gandjariella thermophila TaxID=1931992 RepID=A0A4D4J972_9PSEU|nr:hypothetical protein [Gandjariella thermophila]GDY32094.1 hypothetical protein GTS_37270 [Gandjariella thermophila]